MAVDKAVRMQRVRTFAFFVLALVVIISIGVLLLEAKPAHAADFRVNWMEEDVGDDGKGDGECSIEPHPIGTRPKCTLRAAIEEANANGASDTITFSSGGTITLTLGQLVIADNISGPDLTIEGPGGSGLRVSGIGTNRVFLINSGSEGTINRLTITGGDAGDTGFGGGILISNGGTLTVRDSTVSGNTSGEAGGGITNGGTLTLTNSTVSGNTSGLAGGIFNNGGTLTLTNSTVSANTSHTDGGGIYTEGGAGTAKLTNTIVARNAANRDPDVSGLFTSQGNNLIGNTSGSGSTNWALSDLLNVEEPRLGPLQNNGGPTNTHALLQGSPAIDAANGTFCPTIDQRGVARLQDGDGNGTQVCDIGAFEVANTPPTITNLKPAPGSSTRDRTPVIAATVRDAQTNLAKSNIRLFVDNNRKTTFSYNASTDRLSYTSGQLSFGRHTVKIVANDLVLSTTRSWSFKVVRG